MASGHRKTLKPLSHGCSRQQSNTILLRLWKRDIGVSLRAETEKTALKKPIALLMKGFDGTGLLREMGRQWQRSPWRIVPSWAWVWSRTWRLRTQRTMAWSIAMERHLRPER